MVGAAVLACSELQTGGADVNRGYNREDFSFPQVQLLSLLLPSGSVGVACRGRGLPCGSQRRRLVPRLVPPDPGARR